MRKTLLMLLSAVPLAAQSPITLKEAVQLALTKNPSILASAANVKAAEQRVAQAHANYLPKLNVSESYARSNNPVFVFSTLLTQRRFTEQNFAIPSLNHPESVQNFQSQAMVDQVVFDAGMTRNTVRSAQLGVHLTSEEERRVQMEVIAGVLRTYYGAVLSAENAKVAEEAVRSAEADLKKAKAVRAAGMSTDADVLSIQVHLAAVREQQIRRKFDLEVAKAALNEALGLPLDTEHALATTLAPTRLPEGTIAELEREALDQRPEARQAGLSVQIAEAQGSSARSALYPQVSIRAGFETDTARFVNQGAGNWLAAATMKWNLFNGGENRARIRESAETLNSARAQEQRTGSALRLQVRESYFNLKSAQERIEVAQAAVAMAEESLRITRNRYENGLTNVTDLLRNETALLETRTRHLAAVYDQRLAASSLEMAAGSLSKDSPVLD